MVVEDAAVVVEGQYASAFLALLPFGDDDSAGVASDVDDVAQVVLGAVVGRNSSWNIWV